MSWFDGMRHRWQTLLNPRKYEDELREEMQFHVALDAMQQGDPWTARRRFGNRTRHTEDARRLTLLRLVDGVRADAGYAWRSLRRSPGVAAAVVVTLALGIGANAATFTVLDALYLRPPSGIDDPKTLRRMWVKHFNSGDGVPFTSTAMHHPMFRAVASAASDSANVAVYTTDWSLRMGPALGAPRIRAVFASAPYFRVLGVRPARGRLFTDDEDRMGQPVRVVVVSDAFWRGALGARRDVLGSWIQVGSVPHQVVGLLGPEFRGLDLQPADVWVPLATYPQPDWMKERWWESTNIYSLRVVARVARSFDDGAFARRATQVVRQLERDASPAHADSLMQVMTGSIIEARGPGKRGQELLIASRLGGGAVLLLLVACANVINLLLARAVARRREIALRLALGVTRRQLVRLLTIDTLLLTTMAATASMALASWGGRVLRALLLPDIEWGGEAFDGRVALFTAVVALAAGLSAALIPALQASRPDLVSTLAASAQGSGARHRSRLRRALLVAQASFSVVLVLGAVFFVRSLRNVQGIDIGYDASQLLFAHVRFAEGSAPSSRRVATGMRDVAERLRGRRGVEVVARAAMEPMQGFGINAFFYGSDSSDALGAMQPTMSAVSAGYFAAAGIKLLAGSDFTEVVKGSAARELVVNLTMARLLWPGRSAIGRCITFGTRVAPCYLVVGVVETVHFDRLIETSARPQYYLPLDDGESGTGGGLGADTRPNQGWAGTTLIVRASPNALGAVTRDVRAMLRAVWPAGEPAIAAMTENLEPEFRPWRLGATLFTTFGPLAVLVALVGVYATVSYSVSQRRREFGVRMALGAGVGRVVRQVLGDSVRTVAIGVAVGIAISIASGRLVAGLLYGISSTDPATIVVVATALLAVSALAAMLPAWRASRVDPVETLRAEG